MNDDLIEIIDDIDTDSSQQSRGVNHLQNVEKKVAETKFELLEPEQEKIEVVDAEDQSRNKSGIILVVVLFVLLGLFILFLPKITEIFGSLF